MLASHKSGFGPTGVIFCAFFTFAAMACAEGYGGGTGTPENPYQIWTADQMNAIGVNPEDWTKHFKLMADIDLSVYPVTQYNIIGNAATKFTGIFDGNNHVIHKFIYRTTAVVDNVGLFGYLDHAMIQNLSVKNISIWTHGKYVGGLVGWSHSSTLIACRVGDGAVEGNRYVGGLVGGNSSGFVTNCYAADCCVNGEGDLGGLIGYNEGVLTNCYATGPVYGGVYGTNNIGGLIGNNSGLATNCYAAVGVGGTINVGGLVGFFTSGTMTTCLWDTQATAQDNGVGYGSSDGVTGKTTPEMMTRLTFTNADWDFASTWAICEGTNYPRLKWQIPAKDWVCPDGVGTDDLLYLAERWMASTPETVGAADGNGDGRVDLEDLGILSENWGQ